MATYTPSGTAGAGGPAMAASRSGRFQDHYQAVLAQAIKLRDGRPLWLSLWDELALYFHPDRSGFISEIIDGEDTRDDVYGSVAEIARRGLATAVSTMLRPAGRRWFKARTRNPGLMGDDQVRHWCDIVTELTYGHLYDPRALFEKQLSEADSDVVTFGTAVVQVGWNKSKRHLKFKSIPLQNVVLAIDDTGTNDMAFVFWKLTLRQILAMGLKPTEQMQQALNQNTVDLEKKYEVLHACLPNDDFRRFGFGPFRLPYASLWIAVQEKFLMDFSGYYEFPYVTPRWDTATGEIYGRSPAMIALRDARLANAITKSMVDAAEMALRPPTYSYADMIRGNLSLYAGGHTLIDAQGLNTGTRDPIGTIQLGTQPQKMLELLAVIEDRIAAAFFRDILELPSARAKDMTATEINARLDQYLRQAAPVFSRLEASYNAGVMNRVFSILMREGVFPDPPEALYEQDIEFEYESPIKAARDKAEALKVVEGLGILGQFAQFKPEVMDNIDFDVATRFTGQKLDLPQIIFTVLEDMLKVREERAKKMQMAEMAQLAQTAGPALAQLTGGAAKAKEAGLLGNDEPFPIPAPELMPDARLIEDAAYRVMPEEMQQ